eukprot:COSAG02_NODE_3062_length_7447_cov_14.342678_6_plen_151_part_00
MDTHSVCVYNEPMQAGVTKRRQHLWPDRQCLSNLTSSLSSQIAITTELESTPWSYYKAYMAVVLLRRWSTSWVVARCWYATVTRAGACWTTALIEVRVETAHQLRHNICIGRCDIMMLAGVSHYVVQLWWWRRPSRRGRRVRRSNRSNTS